MRRVDEQIGRRDRRRQAIRLYLMEPGWPVLPAPMANSAHIDIKRDEDVGLHATPEVWNFAMLLARYPRVVPPVA